MKCEDIKQFTRDGNYRVNATMEQLVNILKEDEERMGLILESDFQRGHVWTEQQQIAWCWVNIDELNENKSVDFLQHCTILRETKYTF